MEIKNIVIGNNEFQLRPFNAITQFHLARKLAGILAPAVSGGEDGKGDAAAFFQYIAEMPDDKANDLLFKILSRTYVKAGKTGQYTPLVSNGQIMLDDLEFFDLMNLAYEILKDNFENFFARMPENWKSLIPKSLMA